MGFLFNKCKRRYFSEKPLIFEWIFICIVSFIMLISFVYVDFRSLTIWSTNLLDVISQGNIRDFYNYSYINEYGAAHNVCGSNIFSVLPMAIWNIPIWICQHFFGLRIVEHSWMLVWSKLFLAFCEGVMLLFTYKITKLITNDKNKSLWAVFFSASFIFVYIGVYYSGQNDIVSIAFGTMAVYFLLKNKTTWFLLLSSCAVATKPFFMFIFIPLVLLSEKNIFKIMLKGIAGISLTYICGLLYKGAPMYAESIKMGPMSKNLELLSYGTFGYAFNARGSWFFLLYSAFCVIAYITKKSDTEIMQKYVIYMSFAPIVLMSVFTGIQHYRPIYLAPFMFILIVLNDSWTKVNHILKAVFSSTSVYAICCYSDLVFATNSMNNTPISKIFNVDTALNKYPSIYSVIKKYTEDYFVGLNNMVATLAAACLIIMLVINYPEFKRKPDFDCSKFERWIIWFDMLVIVPVLILVFKMYFTYKSGDF